MLVWFHWCPAVKQEWNLFFILTLVFSCGCLSCAAEAVKSPSRKPKCSKGYHCSRNAYMLVYKVQADEHPDLSETSVEVPGEPKIWCEKSQQAALWPSSCVAIQPFYRGWWTETTTGLRSGAWRCQTCGSRAWIRARRSTKRWKSCTSFCLQEMVGKTVPQMFILGKGSI